MNARMGGGNLSSSSSWDGSAGSGADWSGSGTDFAPQGDVGHMLDKRDGGVVDKGGSGGDNSGNIAWGVALVASPIVILLLLMSLRSAASKSRRGSVGADKKSEGRQERYRSVEERVEDNSGIASPDLYVHGDRQQWTQAKTTDGEGDKERHGRYQRPPRSSSLEDFRHDTHEPGSPDVIWRNTTYSF